MAGDEKKLKDSDEFQTPTDVLRAADDLALIMFDLAATEENNVLRRIGAEYAGRYFTKKEDALAQDWARLLHALGNPGGSLFLNPPFSKPNLSLFSEKTKEEVCLGANIHFVGPANTASLWFHHLIFAGCDVTAKEHSPRGALKGTVLHLDHSYYSARLTLFDYRLIFTHPDMPVPEEANKGHFHLLMKSKRKYAPKLRAAAQEPNLVPAQASESAPALPDPSPEGQ